jgi:cell cycle checkpoint protein
MDYPDDREVLETFECTQSVSFRFVFLFDSNEELAVREYSSYRFAHIARTLRALQNSTKTSLRIDDDGLLSLQFMMPSPKPRGGLSTAFIDYRVCTHLVFFRWTCQLSVSQCLPLDDGLQ